MIQPLSAKRRVVAMDLPGFGLSVKPDTRYSIRLYADAVEAVVADLEKSDATFETLILGIAKSYPFQYRKNTVLE